jgi:hypothetical protein
MGGWRVGQELLVVEVAVDLTCSTAPLRAWLRWSIGAASLFVYT